MYCCFKSGTPLESAYVYAISFAVLMLIGRGKFFLDRLVERAPVFDFVHRSTR